MIQFNKIISHKFHQNEMAKKLSELYKEKWDVCNDNILKSMEECAMPFLLAPTDAYCSSSKKIMILGQETFGWAGELYNPEDQTIENLMNLYDLFVNISRGYNSPFWSFINTIQEEVSIDTQIIINNVVKIGKRGQTGCDKNINNLIFQHFNILLEEINILKPDMLIFLSGPRYDKYIKTFVGNFELEQMDPSINCRKFAQIKFDNKELPVAYRCYHPRYLRMTRNFDNYLKIILDLIRNKIY